MIGLGVPILYDTFCELKKRASRLQLFRPDAFKELTMMPEQCAKPSPICKRLDEEPTMKSRPIALRTYTTVMERYDDEDRRRTEVIRIIGKQRIQTSREQTAVLHAFYKTLITSGKLSPSNN